MRLIDADALIGAIRHDVNQTTDSNWGYGLNHAIPIVRSQPTVDAIPVVRCKVCRFWKNDDELSKQPSWLPCMAVMTTSDFFCGGGEKK